MKSLKVIPDQTERTGGDSLLDREEVARLLGISPRTLDRWHLLRKGPPRIRYGGSGHVRYRRSAVEKWVLSQEICPLSRTE